MKRHLSKFLILCLSAMLVCSTAFVGFAAEPGDGEGSDNGAISAQNDDQNEPGDGNGETPSETPEKNPDEKQPELPGQACSKYSADYIGPSLTLSCNQWFFRTDPSLSTFSCSSGQYGQAMPQ